MLGLDNEKTINFLKLGEAKPNIQLKKVMTIPEEKLETLFKLICKIGNKRTLIFCNHRDAVDRISELLREKGIDRNVSRWYRKTSERERALLKFRNDSTRILITTDLACRGLDIPEVESIVGCFNYLQKKTLSSTETEELQECTPKVLLT